MNIQLSRHAKRRAKLYNIPEQTVIDILRQQSLSHAFIRGQHEIVQQIEGFSYPVKIVFVVEDATVTVITAYPLKKEAKK